MSKIQLNCCNEAKDDEDCMCCAKCKHGYHRACLKSTGQFSTNTESTTEWMCPACTSRRPKGNSENTPVRNKNTLVGSEQNVTKRSTKRVAVSSLNTEKSSQLNDIREMVSETVRAEMKEMLTQMRTSIKSVLNSELKVIREEITDMKNSINFINSQYEDFLKEHCANLTAVKDLKENNTKLEATINALNTRVNELEQRTRYNNLELQCVPERKNENLIKIVEQLGSVIGLDITSDKIANVTRVAKVNRQSTRPRSVIVQFNSPLTRDSVMAAVIKYNKSNPRDKLNTSHIGIGLSEEKQPIYIMEHLSPGNKALHAAARLKAKEKDYKYVWVRNGRILIRKDDNSDYKVVKNMDFLSNLS
ncbi:unnamed protein product [Parnassius mnemosyne]|uniref:PHD-type domain-containing protein n=1 Tax=Parnassius mnemosyne TaxID=213953 RepID=A0AAV1LML2_9NEOP